MESVKILLLCTNDLGVKDDYLMATLGIIALFSGYRHGHNRMIVEFTTTYATAAYHH
jgi:hydrogenase/urease accessory protein HupE